MRGTSPSRAVGGRLRTVRQGVGGRPLRRADAAMAQRERAATARQGAQPNDIPAVSRKTAPATSANARTTEAGSSGAQAARLRELARRPSLRGTPMAGNTF